MTECMTPEPIPMEPSPQMVEPITYGELITQTNKRIDYLREKLMVKASEAETFEEVECYWEAADGLKLCKTTLSQD